MPLVTSNQFETVPQGAQSFALGRQQGQQIRAADQASQFKATQQQQAQQATQLSRQALKGGQGAIEGLAAVDPQKAKAIQSFLSKQTEDERAETLREQESLTRSSLNALSLPPEKRRAFIAQEIDRCIHEGRDT